jgi:hypothetical protein
MNRDFPLRALRIPAGWRIDYNDFTETPLDHPEAWTLALKSSLLMLTHERRGMLVDLGWYPDGEAHGRYRLRAFEGDHTGTERSAFETRNPAVVITELERLLDSINRGDVPQGQ